MGSALFKYSLSPPYVPYSSAGLSSIVQLTVTVSNPSSNAVPCQALTFVLPSGPDSSELCLNSDIIASPGAETPWAMASAGSTAGAGNEIVAMPLPPVTSLAGHESIEIAFSNVVVNDASGSSAIIIGEHTWQYAQYQVWVDKQIAISPPGDSPPAQGAPQIAVFTATPSDVAQDGQTLLEWTVIGAINCIVTPGPFVLQSVTTGVLPLTIRETTPFTLTAIAPTGAASTDEITVTVMPVSASITSSAEGAVAPNTAVTLQWNTQCAYSCSIEPDVGPVPLNGAVVVRPQTTTTYTLTATGLEPQTPQVTITVS